MWKALLLNLCLVVLKLCNLYLKVPVNKPVHIKVIIVLTKRVDQGLSDLEPTNIKDKLQSCEHGNHIVGPVDPSINDLFWVQILASKQGKTEVSVHGQSHRLKSSTESSCK